MLLVSSILFVNISIMCLHPVVDQNLAKTVDKYETIGLEEYDNCDYMYSLNDVCKNDLVVIQLNIRGISSKRSQLIDLIDSTVKEKCPNIVLLSETWLTPFSPEFSIPGFMFYHRCRWEKKGGRVGVLVSEKIRCKLWLDLSSEMVENECITLDITLCSGKHCLVSSMYRPPKSNGQTFLCCYDSILCQMKKENLKTIIIGLDHNLDFMKSAQHSVTNEFIQSNLDFGLIPTITQPTRITQMSAILIDNIIVSQSLCGLFVSSILINDMSDHLLTACVIPSLVSSKKESVTITSRDTRPRNMKALTRQLSEINWAEIINDDSCSKNMESFTNTLMMTIDQCIPEQTRYVNH